MEHGAEERPPSAILEWDGEVIAVVRPEMLIHRSLILIVADEYDLKVVTALRVPFVEFLHGGRKSSA